MKRNCLRLLAGAAAAVICTQPFSVGAWAELVLIPLGETVSEAPEKEMPVSGKCGDHLTFQYDGEGTLIISGTGEMYEYVGLRGGMGENQPWLNVYSARHGDYVNTNITTIVVEDGVETLGSSAFVNCLNLTSVQLSPSVWKIGSFCFDGCESFRDVQIPDTVDAIGDDPFYNTAWENAQPDGVLYVNDIVIGFKGFMSDFATVAVRDGTKQVAPFALKDDWESSATQILIPDDIEMIAMTSLNSYTWKKWYDEQPDGVLYFGNVAVGYKGEMPENTSLELKEETVGVAENAFAWQENLVSVIIPEKVKRIRESAFEGCANLQSVTILNPDCKLEGNYNIFLNNADYPDLNDEPSEPPAELKEGENIYKLEDWYSVVSFYGTLRGYKNSTTEAYAKKYNYRFEPLPEPEYITGDPDGDGAVTINDALCTLEICNYLNMDMADEISEAAMNAADVDGNGAVELSDAIYILTYLNFNDVMDTPTTWEEILQM